MLQNSRIMVFHHLVYAISLINIYEYTLQGFYESLYLIEFFCLFLNYFVKIIGIMPFMNIINTCCLLYAVVYIEKDSS